ncbi:YggT family protein [Nocardia sp. NPDC088792]|uniref:YggT family protein n=1 Tax=Nocardia sp. NPDC088792 TaxID=3364332 RepID=UPI0037FACA33
MTIVGTVLGWLLTVFLLILIVRLIVDWVQTLSSGSIPPWTYKVRRFSYAVTEPVIAPLRRVLPPVRLGSVSLDLAFTIVFILVLVLRSVAFSL